MALGMALTWLWHGFDMALNMALSTIYQGAPPHDPRWRRKLLLTALIRAGSSAQNPMAIVVVPLIRRASQAIPGVFCGHTLQG